MRRVLWWATLAVICFLLPSSAAAQYGSYCPPGSVPVQHSMGYMCRCPDGSWANYGQACAAAMPRCPAGSQECGNVCCNSNVAYCSRYGCTPHGANDCGSHYCNPGQQCSRGGGCIPSGTTDCGGGTYCRAGLKCASGNKCLEADWADCGGGVHCSPGQICGSRRQCTTQEAIDEERRKKEQEAADKKKADEERKEAERKAAEEKKRASLQKAKEAEVAAQKKVSEQIKSASAKKQDEQLRKAAQARDEEFRRLSGNMQRACAQLQAEYADSGINGATAAGGKVCGFHGFPFTTSLAPSRAVSVPLPVTNSTKTEGQVAVPERRTIALNPALRDPNNFKRLEATAPTGDVAGASPRVDPSRKLVDHTFGGPTNGRTNGVVQQARPATQTLAGFLSPRPAPKPIDQATAQDAFKYGVLARDAYRDRVPGQQDSPLAGYKVVKSHQDPSGLEYTSYKNDKTNEYVIAFRGTEGLTDKKDWVANVAARAWIPGATVPAQYRRAAEIAQQAHEDCRPPCKVVLAGHSLGGGLASYAGLAKGDQVYTFNGARNLLSAGGANKNQLNVIVQGDPVGDPLNRGRVRSVEGLVAGWGSLPGQSVYVPTTSPKSTLQEFFRPLPLNPAAGSNYSHPMDGMLGGIFDARRSGIPP